MSNRLAEQFLEGLGISTKGRNVRPTKILDVIEGLLNAADIPKALDNIKHLTGTDYAGDKTTIKLLCSDLVMMQLVEEESTSGLYLKLIVSNKRKPGLYRIPTEDVKSIIQHKTDDKRKLYKSLGKNVERLNEALKDMLVLYVVYSDEIRFVVVAGKNKDEYLDSLANSGMQTPATIDKLYELLAIKGIDE